MQTVREKLIALSEERYRKFSSSLVPTGRPMLGVRLPLVRKLAKEIAKGDWRAYLGKARDDYLEEVMLQGMVIGAARADVEETLGYAAAFVPKIDNWSVCDSFCSSLALAKKYRERFWSFLRSYLISGREFEARFGAVMLLDHFIVPEYIGRVLACLDRVPAQGYYARMAVAWAVSVCFAKFPEQTMNFLKENRLDDFTYNKSLQKITESYRVDKETKSVIRAMKR